MPFLINDECIQCGACVPVCPNEAISEDDPIYRIDPDRCTECVPVYDEQQCADVCPVEACVPDPAHKATRGELEAKYKQLHPE